MPSIDPCNLSPDGRDLDLLNQLLKADNVFHRFSKITKSSGEKVISPTERFFREDNPKYHHKNVRLPDGKMIQLKNYSLVKFPNENCYYVIKEFKGKGTFGKVKTMPFCFEKNHEGNYEKKELELSKQVVIKVIKTSNKASASQLGQDEARLASLAGADNNAKYGATLENPLLKSCKTYVKLSYVPGDNLADVFTNNPNLPLIHRLHIINDLIISLIEVNKRGYCYIDLKPENIMYTPGNLHCVRLIDWSSCVEKNAGNNIFTRKGTPISRRSRLRSNNVHTYEAHQLAGTIAAILSTHECYIESQPFDYTELPCFTSRRLAYDISLESDLYYNIHPESKKKTLNQHAYDLVEGTAFDFDELENSPVISAPFERKLLSPLINELNALCHETESLVPTSYQTLLQSIQLAGFTLTAFTLRPIGKILDQFQKTYSEKENNKSNLDKINDLKIKISSLCFAHENHEPIKILHETFRHLIKQYHLWKNKTSPLHESANKNFHHYIAMLNTNLNENHFDRLLALLCLNLTLNITNNVKLDERIIHLKQALTNIKCHDDYPADFKIINTATVANPKNS